MNSVTFAIGIGTLLGIIAAFLIIKRIGESEWRLHDEFTGAFARRVTWFVGVATFPFAWFLGFIVGGNFGGALAGRFSEEVGLSAEILIPIGIGAGIFVCSALLSIATALTAFIIARTIKR